MLLFKVGLLSLLIHVGYGIIVIGPVSDPPPPYELAKMARYIMRNSDWVSIATISSLKNITGYPFVSLQSVSDGPPSNSTGVPYLYLTDLDVTAQDLSKDSRCTIIVSLLESDYCKSENFDPQDPRCAKLMITGRMIKVDNKSDEHQFAENALFTKHPVMKTWPKNHNFYVTKVDIEQIAVFDFFGGMKYISTQDYFNAYNDTVSEDIEFDKVEFIEITA